MSKRIVTRESMIRDTQRSIADIEQFIRDVQYWNNHRTEHPPFDCEDLIIARAAYLRHLEVLKSGVFPIPGEHIEAARKAIEQGIGGTR